MRDFGLLLGCVLLALILASWKDTREQSERLREQRLMVGLGAAGGLTPSPERSLLEGDFLMGLQQQPEKETYQRLAAAFLVSHDLHGQSVTSWAFHDQLMARVRAESLEVFDPQGKPLQPEVFELQGKRDQPNPLALKGVEFSLEAEGDWIVGRGASGMMLLRMGTETPQVYLSSTTLTVDSETVTLDEGPVFRWNGSKLEAVLSP